MTSFLRRLSMDSDSLKSSEVSNRVSHEQTSMMASRRNYFAAGIEMVRRRFSLQPCNDLPNHLHGITLGQTNNGSLPNFEEVAYVGLYTLTKSLEKIPGNVDIRFYRNFAPSVCQN
ncbi:hypothetical protein KIN20_007464 [Parelaphostrongylus tenuis]|uniref:Uncharacterized protein n=1 Tax=Parelaphostrongylus tenuis TaxID=148309 RepID=A0AAD5M6L6_PARTN|nr:hypothetical protein KIN20_007464 [Parelaphostrongylus tenuis]